MSKAIGIVIVALFSCVSAEPYYISSPYYSSGYAAALTAAPVATIPAAPALPVPALPAVSAVPAVPAVQTVPAVPTVPASWNPVTSLSAYAYGSEYSIQQLPVVNPTSAQLVYAGSYGSSFPWAYASDYYYRR